jgi:hypothetical protein
LANDPRVTEAAILAAPFHLNPLDVLAMPREDKALLAAHNRALGRERQKAQNESEKRLKQTSAQRPHGRR